MASSPAAVEIARTTNVEAARPRPGSEATRTQPKDGLGVNGALGALNLDKPQVKDRTDLVNLAGARSNQRRYKRFDSLKDYRESKAGTVKSKDRNINTENAEIKGTPAAGMNLDQRYLNIRQELKQKWLQEHPGEDDLSEAGQNYMLGYMDRSQKDRPTLKSDTESIFRERYAADADAYDIKEKTRIYEDPEADPVVRAADEKIIRNTNLDLEVQAALESGAMDYRQIWARSNLVQNRQEWSSFVRQYPEKAAAYAEKNAQIKAALERQQAEQVNSSATEDSSNSNIVNTQGSEVAESGSLSAIQEENNQLLADSVNVIRNTDEGTNSGKLDGNDVEKGSDQPAESQAERDELLANSVRPEKNNVNSKSPEQSKSKESINGNPGQEYKLNRNESTGVDTSWDVNFNRGTLNIRGDMLTYTPNILRQKNPYDPGTEQYNYFEKYQTKYSGPEDVNKKDLIEEQRKRAERGIELATQREVDGAVRKELTPEFWEIMRANPNRVSINPLQEFAYIGKRGAAKSVSPTTYQISNGDRIRDVDVNFKWNRVRIDRYSLPVVQQKALEYLDQQVAQGVFSSDLLSRARDIVESHKSQASNSRAKVV